MIQVTVAPETSVAKTAPFMRLYRLSKAPLWAWSVLLGTQRFSLWQEVGLQSLDV